MRIFKKALKETEVTPSEPNTKFQPAGQQENGRAPDASVGNAGSGELQRLLNGPVAVHVRGENGAFTLYEPQLGLLVACSDLAEGHKRLMREREQRLREFAEAGMLDMLLGAGTGMLPTEGPSTLNQLRPFLIKAVVVAGLLLYFLSAIGGALRDVGYNLEKQLDGVSHWNPDKVEMYREKSQRIADRLGPTMRALLSMFHESAQNATAAAPGGNGAQSATNQNNATAKP